jgi:hypothetical protein
MPTPIIIKLDVTKLKREWFFKGAKGTYVDLVLYENDRESPYGDSHTLKQSPSKEARDAGEKAVIAGNGRWMPRKAGRQCTAPSKQQTSPATNAESPESDEIPF